MSKYKNTAEKSADVINDVPEIEAYDSAQCEAPVIPQVEQDKQDKQAEPESAKSEPLKYVYIGPTVVRTELIEGRVFVCDGISLEERLAGTFEKFPEAKKLFVSPENAAEATMKIRSGGNSLSAAYKHLEKIKTGG